MPQHPHRCDGGGHVVGGVGHVARHQQRGCQQHPGHDGGLADQNARQADGQDGELEAGRDRVEPARDCPERRPVRRVVEVCEYHRQPDDQDDKHDAGERRRTTPLPLLQRQIAPGTDPHEYEQRIAEIRVVRCALLSEAKQDVTAVGRIHGPGSREQYEAEPDRDKEKRVRPGGMPGRLEGQQRGDRGHQRLIPVVVRGAKGVLPQHDPADQPQQVNSGNGPQLHRGRVGDRSARAFPGSRGPCHLLRVGSGRQRAAFC